MRIRKGWRMMYWFDETRHRALPPTSAPPKPSRSECCEFILPATHSITDLEVPKKSQNLSLKS